MEDAVSLRDEIERDCPNLGQQIVKVKLWKNRKVLIRAMTGYERIEMNRRIGPRPAEQSEEALELRQRRICAAAVITCARDPQTGEKAFTWDDLDWMANQPIGLLDDLAGRAFDLSGIGADAVETAEKN